MKRERLRKKSRVLTIFVLLMFISTSLSVNPALAQSNAAKESTQTKHTINPERIKLNDQYGLVTETYLADTPIDDGKFVIYLQDAHCVYDAQENIQKIINYFQNDFNLNLVALEGGSGPINVDIFRAYPDMKVKEKVLDKYVREGILSGAEVAAIMSERRGNYAGIEDMRLYFKNKKAFLEAYKNKEGLDAVLMTIRENLTEIADRILSEELKEYYKKVSQYEKNEISIFDFVNYLIEKGNIDISGFKNLERLIGIEKRDKEIDLNKLDIALEIVSKGIRRQLKISGSEKLGEFGDRYGRFKRRETKREEYALYLKRQAEELINVTYKRHPEIDEYLAHVKEMESVKGEDMFAEIEAVKAEARERLFTDKKESDWARNWYHLEVLEKLSKLELTRDDLGYLEKNKGAFSGKTFEGFIKLFNPDARLDLGSLDGLIRPNLEFYDAAVERDRALYENLTRLMESEDERLALVLTGGFHTDAIKKELKKNGYSYIVISPQITHFEEETPYVSVMMSQGLPAASSLAPLQEIREPERRREIAQEIVEATENAATLREWLNSARTLLADEKLPAIDETIIEDVIEARVNELDAEARARAEAEILEILKRAYEVETGKSIAVTEARSLGELITPAEEQQQRLEHIEKNEKIYEAKETLRAIEDTLEKKAFTPSSLRKLFEDGREAFNAFKDHFDNEGRLIEKLINKIMKPDFREMIKNGGAMLMLDHLRPISFLNEEDKSMKLGTAAIKAEEAIAKRIADEFNKNIAGDPRLAFYASNKISVEKVGRKVLVLGIKPEHKDAFKLRFFQLAEEMVGEEYRKLGGTNEEHLKLFSKNELDKDSDTRLVMSVMDSAWLDELIRNIAEDPKEVGRAEKVEWLLREGKPGEPLLSALRGDRRSEIAAAEIAKSFLYDLEDGIAQAHREGEPAVYDLDRKRYSEMERIPRDSFFNYVFDYVTEKIEEAMAKARGKKPDLGGIVRSGPPRISHFEGSFEGERKITKADGTPGSVRYGFWPQIAEPFLNEIREKIKDKQAFTEDEMTQAGEHLTMLMWFLRGAKHYAERNLRNHRMFQEVFMPGAILDLYDNKARAINDKTGEPERIVDHVTSVGGDEHLTVFRRPGTNDFYVFFIDFDNFKALDLLQRYGKTLPHDDSVLWNLHEVLDEELAVQIMDFSDKEFKERDLRDIFDAMSERFGAVEVPVNFGMSGEGMDEYRKKLREYDNKDPGTANEAIPASQIHVIATEKYQDKRRPIGEAGNIGITGVVTKLNLDETKLGENVPLQDKLAHIYDEFTKAKEAAMKLEGGMKALGKKGDVKVAMKGTEDNTYRRFVGIADALDIGEKRIIDVIIGSNSFEDLGIERDKSVRLKAVERDKNPRVVGEILYKVIRGAHKNIGEITAELNERLGDGAPRLSQNKVTEDGFKPLLDPIVGNEQQEADPEEILRKLFLFAAYIIYDESNSDLARELVREAVRGDNEGVVDEYLEAFEARFTEKAADMPDFVGRVKEIIQKEKENLRNQRFILDEIKEAEKKKEKAEAASLGRFTDGLISGEFEAEDLAAIGLGEAVPGVERVLAQSLGRGGYGIELSRLDVPEEDRGLMRGAIKNVMGKISSIIDKYRDEEMKLKPITVKLSADEFLAISNEEWAGILSEFTFNEKGISIDYDRSRGTEINKRIRELTSEKYQTTIEGIKRAINDSFFDKRGITPGVKLTSDVLLEGRGLRKIAEEGGLGVIYGEDAKIRGEDGNYLVSPDNLLIGKLAELDSYRDIREGLVKNFLKIILIPKERRGTLFIELEKFGIKRKAGHPITLDMSKLVENIMAEFRAMKVLEAAA